MPAASASTDRCHTSSSIGRYLGRPCTTNFYPLSSVSSCLRPNLLLNNTKTSSIPPYGLLERPKRPFALLLEMKGLTKQRTSTDGIAQYDSRWHRPTLFAWSQKPVYICDIIHMRVTGRLDKVHQISLVQLFYLRFFLF